MRNVLQLATQVNELATGTITQDDFNSVTTTAAIGDALSKTTLPGSVTPPAEGTLSTGVLLHQPPRQISVFGSWGIF